MASVGMPPARGRLELAMLYVPVPYAEGSGRPGR